MADSMRRVPGWPRSGRAENGAFFKCFLPGQGSLPVGNWGFLELHRDGPWHVPGPPPDRSESGFESRAAAAERGRGRAPAGHPRRPRAGGGYRAGAAGRRLPVRGGKPGPAPGVTVARPAGPRRA